MLTLDQRRAMRAGVAPRRKEPLPVGGGEFACVHRGAEPLVFPACGCAHPPPAWHCGHARGPERCIVAGDEKVEQAAEDFGYGVCRTCALRQPPVGKPAKKCPIEWISLRKLTEDTKALAAKLPPNIAGVAGIPRSGMIPASILATFLHVPLYEARKDGQLCRLGHGSRGAALGFSGDPTGPIVIVDDTVYSGNELRRARGRFADRKAIYAAVYVRPQARKVAHVYGRLLPSPHLLEWNLFNAGQLAGFAANPLLHGGFALDFDGVLCHDPPVPDADGGPRLERYRQWLLNAPPLYLPRSLPVKLIVTFRLERFRPETDSWLARWGVRCERLIMHPAATASERNRSWNTADHKGRHFKESGCAFFIESDPRQAREIFEYAGKPVICPAAESVWA